MTKNPILDKVWAKLPRIFSAERQTILFRCGSATHVLARICGGLSLSILCAAPWVHALCRPQHHPSGGLKSAIFNPLRGWALRWVVLSTRNAEGAKGAEGRDPQNGPAQGSVGLDDRHRDQKADPQPPKPV